MLALGKWNGGWLTFEICLNANANITKPTTGQDRFYHSPRNWPLANVSSYYARSHDGQASEEAQQLHELRELELDIVADDPAVLTKGERELEQLVKATVRDLFAEATAKAGQRFESFPSGLINQLQTQLPSDASRIETRTFFEAIDGYRAFKKKTGQRKGNGRPSPSVQNYLNHARRLKNTLADFQMWELADKNKIDELFSQLRTRPVSSETGKPISAAYARHLMNCLWSILWSIYDTGHDSNCVPITK